MVTRAASLIDSFHPWLSPADADLVAARAHAAEIGPEASGASGAAEAQPAAKRPRPAAASVLPTPAQTRSLVARLSGNPGLAGEVLRAGEAYQGVKVATSARVGTHVFKSDAFDSFGFRLALWPRPFRGDSLADELRTFAWATRPWHGALTARQRERVTEFVTTGRIARGDLAQASQDATARLAFRDVHGIGPSRAVELQGSSCANVASTDALNGPDRSTPGFHEPQLYCGIARLPAAAGAPPSEGPSYLRIDIKSWHWSQRGTALVAFTGNNRFNRALRRYADVLGLHLSDRAMCNRVLQGERPAGDRWNDEPRVVTEEAHVFKELGLEFRQPHERLVFFVDQMHSALEEAAGLVKDSRQGGSASSNSAT
ncbi:hypothetical protein FNF29_02077 [Cafeteria roenbergensis]|uniref:DNA polymerase beta thumb domain-containing protein n=1 Tax=Cafeteria roenbergensis TaxID=33653 RepID=A0A5A8CPF4_CAFRO|nr:hypothetical protein FNF29_02077 [Cafeteria roenbergensis]|eukprot:KAA0154933.1 hypothetical protein FNF29_02077 [Cafeteria roenbergensis]